MATTYVHDTFSRIVASGWGAPDTGPAYTGIGSTSGFSVDGTAGIITRDSNPYVTVGVPIDPVTDIAYEMTVSHDALATGGGTISNRHIVREVGELDYHFRMWIRENGDMEFVLAQSNAFYITSPKVWDTYTPGRSYHVKVEAVGVSPTTLRAKVWWDGDPEPEAWFAQGTDNTAGLQVPGTPAYYWVMGGTVTNWPHTTRHDNWSISDASVAPEHPDAGNIASAVPLNPDQSTITVGVIRRGGEVVQAVLYQGGAEVGREAISFDTHEWGNATFRALPAGTEHTVRFEVDTVEQTDQTLTVRTLPTAPTSFVAITGSCQFTGSNHPVFDRISEESAAFISHMGDMHYADATTEGAWRIAMEQSLTAPRFRDMLSHTPLIWSPDNHDRIIVQEGGEGNSLNYGSTDPLTQASWKVFAGADGWASPDGLGRTWSVGRVRFVQTDMWSERDDPDAGTATTPTFLGETQKAWLKSTLEASTEQVIVWLTAWTARNHTNGRWNSFPDESSDLEAWIDAHPDIKSRMILIGGDSHSLQADDGSRTGTAYRFNGIPSLNISGFNRSSDSGDASATEWSIANTSLRQPGDPESDWGGYSRLTFTDDGSRIEMLWEGVRVDSAGTPDVMATFSKSFGSSAQPWTAIKVGAEPAVAMYLGDTKVWP